jgi:hypothetical protein
MPRLIYKDTTDKYIKDLEKVHGGLAVVSSRTVNTGAKFVDRKYKRSLNKFNLRAERFTKGAVKKNLSKPQRSKGGFRKIRDINAIVGVKKMKGGKEHYLSKQETGDRNRGNVKTKGRTALPMDAARTSGSNRKKVAGRFRIQNVSSIQTLKIGGLGRGPARDFGMRGDGFSDNQRWAILNKYKAANPYGWDLKKQFYFRGMNRGDGVFVVKGSKIKMTRQLGGSSVKVKARHKFRTEFNGLTPKKMELIFKREAEKELRRGKLRRN